MSALPLAHPAAPQGEELLPCPFCGTLPISVDLSDDEFGQVQCRNDGCSMAPCTDETTYANAKAAWNNRPNAADEWAAINRLRDEEADSVTVLCDNPEGSPNNAVECCGFWTGFADRRFEGATIHDALVAAVAAKGEAAKVGYPPTNCSNEGHKNAERVALLHEAASLAGRIEAAGLIDYEHSAFEAWKITARDLAPRLRAALAPAAIASGREGAE